MSEFSSKPQTDVFESIWKELKLLMEWQDGFALFWMMVDDTRAVVELRQRLNDYMRCHVQPMRYIKPQTAEGAAADTAQQIFHSEHIKGYPIWLDLSALDGIQDSNGPWHQARERTLSLLNKRRSQLENRIDSPIFIQLPRSFGPRIVEVAPDLWSVRQQVIDLPVADFLSPDSSLKQEPLQPELSIPSAALEDAITQARQVLAKAQARFDKKNTYINHRNLAIKQSELARYLIEIGNVSEAHILAKQSLQCFHDMVKCHPENPQVLRDLSISLNMLGYIEQELGDFKIVKSLFEESLLICEKIHLILGDTPETIRWLSISLSNIGKAEKILGNILGAKKYFKKSLLMFQNLYEIVDDPHEVLRDLSIALNNVGCIERQSGNLMAAKAFFEESLDTLQELRGNIGNNPKILRELSIVLNNIGEIEQESGDLVTAKSLFKDNLRTLRELFNSVEDNPLLLRDLSVSLSQVGNIEQELGNIEEAKPFFEESLSIDRKLYQALDPSPQTVNDFNISLSDMVEIERQLGNSEAAERYQQELERLKSEHPDYLKNA